MLKVLRTVGTLHGNLKFRTQIQQCRKTIEEIKPQAENSSGKLKLNHESEVKNSKLLKIPPKHVVISTRMELVVLGKRNLKVMRNLILID